MGDLLEIVAHGDADALKTLLRNETVDLIVTNKDGQTALHIAAHAGHIDILRLLLTEMTDVNIQDRTGNTALHNSVLANKPECARLLLDNGADRIMRNSFGQSPSQIAIQRNMTDIIAIFESGKDGPQWRAPQPAESPFVIRSERGLSQQQTSNM